MHILLANDDGVFSPGLSALRAELATQANVTIAAPATEQSGVGHSITYLTPLTCKRVRLEGGVSGWAVDGSPADCVKLGVLELVEQPIDFVVSGINMGLNAGINVLYSGTVAAAIEGAFFGIPSIAVSSQFSERSDFPTAAKIAAQLIFQIIERLPCPTNLFNINIPTAAVEAFAQGESPIVDCVGMGVQRYNDRYIKRQDPKGRNYYWSAGDPPSENTQQGTDVHSIGLGHVSISPLHFDLTTPETLGLMQDWSLNCTNR